MAYIAPRAPNPRTRPGAAKMSMATSGSPPVRVRCSSHRRNASAKTGDAANRAKHHQGQVQLAALDQRHHEGSECSGGEDDANHVQVRAPHASRIGHKRDCGDKGRQADGEIDQEHQPPTEPEQVGADQRAAEELANHGRETRSDAVDAECLRALPRREQGVDGGERLWRHRCCRHGLEQSADDQDPRRPCHAAQCRSERKPSQSGEEHSLAAEQIAQPAAGDQEYREGHSITGDDQLRVRWPGAEPRRDRGHRNVDDEEVQSGEEPTREQHGQGDPAMRSGRR
jgi:hypothetical protein